MKTGERQIASLAGGVPFVETSVKFKNYGEAAKYIRQLIDACSGDLALKEKTLSIIRDAGAAPKDEAAQAMAIGEWVQDQIYYVHERRETFQRPATTLRLMAGDCDDFTILIGSMLGTIGIRSAICLLKINGRWAHIFPVALLVDHGKIHRLTLDATLDEPIAELTNPIALVKKRGDVVETLFA